LHSLLKLSVRAFIAWCALALVGILLIDSSVRILAPSAELLIDILQNDYLSKLSTAGSGGDSQIVMSCTTIRDMHVRTDRLIPAYRTFECARIDSVHALVPVVICLIPALAWPLRRRREAVSRTLAFLLVVPLVFASTTAPLLLGLAHTGMYPGSFTSDAPVHALLQPFVFIELGGNWLIALIAALLGIRSGAILAGRWRGANRTPAPPSSSSSRHMGRPVGAGVMGLAPHKDFLRVRELTFTANRMSKAATLARRLRASRQYLQTFRRLQKLNRAFECERGHFGCAAEPGGACTEELLRLIGNAEDDSDGQS
jgi:hypothetical protein